MVFIDFIVIIIGWAIITVDFNSRLDYLSIINKCSIFEYFIGFIKKRSLITIVKLTINMKIVKAFNSIMIIDTITTVIVNYYLNLSDHILTGIVYSVTNYHYLRIK